MTAIEAEQLLYEQMRQCAIAKLGSSASETAIRELADQYYNDDDQPHQREETPEEIAAREADSYEYIAKIEREGGFPW